MKIETGTGWTHKRDSYNVTVEDFGYQLHVKDGDDANWKDAVGYAIDDAADGPFYIRTKADFLAKFKARA